MLLTIALPALDERLFTGFAMVRFSFGAGKRRISV
jgi:hypothetical protein